jgi:DNA-binding response OmpR family regulator
VLHVCLAGPGIAGHRALIDELRIHHDVTLVTDQTRLEQSRVLSGSDVLVLDAGGIRATLRPLLRSLRLRRPELPIVLVDGGLSDDEKADAFTLGVLDYFPAPYEVGLLAERLEVLARARPATPMPRATPNGSAGPDPIPIP